MKNKTDWRRTRSERGPDYRIFKVRLDWAVSPRNNRESRYVVLECPDYVNIIALTADQQVILVRQYRHGVQQETLEIPAGLAEPGEETLLTAQREMLEETGYSGGKWTFLGRVRPNAAFQDNWCCTYLAEGVARTSEPHLDEGEAIEVELHPLNTIPGLIRQGAIDQSLILSAFYLFEQFLAGKNSEAASLGTTIQTAGLSHP